MFWKLWRVEYLLELQEAHIHSKLPKSLSSPITIGDIDTVHNENHPRGLWKLGKIKGVYALGKIEELFHMVLMEMPEVHLLECIQEEGNQSLAYPRGGGGLRGLEHPPHY